MDLESRGSQSTIYEGDTMNQYTSGQVGRSFSGGYICPDLPEAEMSVALAGGFARVR